MTQSCAGIIERVGRFESLEYRRAHYSYPRFLPYPLDDNSAPNFFHRHLKLMKEISEKLVPIKTEREEG